VKPLDLDEQRKFSRIVSDIAYPAPRTVGRLSDYNRSDVSRLLRALQHQEADRVPHLELWVNGRAVLEYVLERELRYTYLGAGTGQVVTPEDHVDFALRLGMDAVPCWFSWRPKRADPGNLEPPPSLVNQLTHLERYLRAVDGTNVGIIACFSSFFDVAIQAMGILDAPHSFRDGQHSAEELMDTLLDHQERVMRVVCDRFASELTAVAITDNIADRQGLIIPTDLFVAVFRARMLRLVQPAKDHGKLLLLSSRGKVRQILPIVYDMGFTASHPVEPDFNDIFEVKREWAGRMALIGNVPTTLLASQDQAAIEETVREYCEKLAPGGGYVLGSAGRITDDIPPANLVTMTRAVHKYGRYGALGRAA
jgi:uroporphyrinogen-III decarboxylase